MTDHPAPPTPAEADLRGMPYMPFQGDRAFTSETWIRAQPEGRCAMLQLWWHAFAKEVPAGSLPDDDLLLARYAGYGVAVKSWLKVKAQAMRGWFKCSDGRLYHNVVAEVVNEAWDKRVKHEGKVAKWREKKRGQRTMSPGTSEGTNGNVSENSPGTSLLREEKRRDNPLPPKTFSRRTNGQQPVQAGDAWMGDHVPAGMRPASTGEYIQYLREKHNDPTLGHGDRRMSRWQHVPTNWKPKASAG